MSQKKCWLDRTTHVIRRLVAATAVDQLDCPTPATQSGVGAHMDPAVSPGRTDGRRKVWQRYRFRTLRYLVTRSYPVQMAYNTYLTRSLIHQGQRARERRTVPVPFLCPTRWHSVADRSG
jgi:hypothetical protein